MIQVIRFTSGGFVLHKVPGKFSGKCSAWYAPDGTLTDAERINAMGHSYPVKRHAQLWAHLQAVGAPYTLTPDQMRLTCDI